MTMAMATAATTRHSDTSLFQMQSPVKHTTITAGITVSMGTKLIASDIILVIQRIENVCLMDKLPSDAGFLQDISIPCLCDGGDSARRVNCMRKFVTGTCGCLNP
mmetsp:Transcript_21728/g.61852  ORF Transcript_21728/g.61852 Transcript_21728/m.61852 type:complete len:105 (+) Transcript_21728:514-828(+)